MLLQQMQEAKQLPAVRIGTARQPGQENRLHCALVPIKHTGTKLQPRILRTCARKTTLGVADFRKTCRNKLLQRGPTCLGANTNPNCSLSAIFKGIGHGEILCKKMK